MKRTKKGKRTKRPSSSESTVPSPIPKEVLGLGQALVKELGLDPGVDTLSNWMAHYIAELIETTETADLEDRPAQSAKCAEAILDLWERRQQLPNGKRPFEDLEPILRALESLDPTDDTPRYFRSPRMAADEAEHNEETEKWLALADGLDHSAKILIRYCLTQAAQTAIDRSKEWVALAEAAGNEDGIDLVVIRIFKDETELQAAGRTDNGARQKQLEARIKHLDDFKKMADALASDLRRQLKQARATKKVS